MTLEEELKGIKNYLEATLWGIKNLTTMFGGLEALEMQFTLCLEALGLSTREQYHSFLQKKYPGDKRYLSGHIESVDKLIELLEEFEKEVRAEIAK